MTNENILDAIGGINDEAVQDAKAYRDTGVHHFRRIPIVLIAAIIAVLLMGVAAAAAIYGSDSKLVCQPMGGTYRTAYEQRSGCNH